jgi:hypothetical protein
MKLKIKFAEEVRFDVQTSNHPKLDAIIVRHARFVSLHSNG